VSDWVRAEAEAEAEAVVVVEVEVAAPESALATPEAEVVEVAARQSRTSCCRCP
jgi:hypothetical protein